MQTKSFLIIVIIISFINKSHSQHKELLNKLYSKQSNSEKIETLHELCKSYTSITTDSFLKYINWGLKLCRPNSKESLNFNFYKVYYLDITNQYKQAENLCDSVIQYCISNNMNEKYHTKMLLQKASFHFNRGDFSQALKVEYKGIALAEKTTDTGLIMDSYLSIGWLFMESNKYQEAIHWFEKGITLIKTQERQKKITNLYLNTASCYNNIGNYTKALELANLGIKNAKNLNKWVAMANGLMIRSDIYINSKKYSLAEKDIEEALIYRKKTKDTLFYVSDLAQYSIFCASVNKTKKGINLAKEGLLLIQQFQLPSKELFLYQALAKNYKVANNFQELSLVLEKIMALKDTIQKQTFLSAAADAQTKYEVDKKELTIKNQNLNLKVKQLYIYGLIGFLILLIPFFFYWFQKIRKRLKNKSLKEIENERRRISNDLHDGVGAFASSIYSGIGNLEHNYQPHKIENLKNTALELIEKLNQTVWVLDMETIALSDLFDKYKNWFVKIIPNFEGIDYEFKDEIGYNKLLKPQDALDLLNMLQEMTNNALKHSHCTKIICEIFSSAKQFKINFKDNGKGFDKDKIMKGNGLTNLEKRAIKLEGTFNCSSDNSGTSILFTTSN